MKERIGIIGGCLCAGGILSFFLAAAGALLFIAIFGPFPAPPDGFAQWAAGSMSAALVGGVILLIEAVF